MRISIALIALFAIAPSSPLDAQVHTDKRLGFKIRPPSKWIYLGEANELGQRGPIFAGERTLTSTKGPGHTPMLRAMYFPKGQQPEAERPDGWPRRTRYANFEDYRARVHGVGAKEESAEVATIGKLSGEKTVYTVSNPFGSLTMYALRIDLEDGELVLEFEVLSEQYAKQRSKFEKSFGTVAIVPTSASKMPETPLWETDFQAWRKLKTSERVKQRLAYGDAWHEARVATKEKGWKLKKHDDFVILSRADSKFTKRATDAATAARAWVEERFAGVSDDEVVPATIRIFADSRELTVFRLREVKTRAYDPVRREIYYAQNKSFGNTGEGFGPLLQGVLEHYLSDKHPMITRNIPRWLDQGMSEYLRSTKSKGRKLEFLSSSTEEGRFRWYEQNNVKPTPLWGLIQETVMETPKDGGPEENWGYQTEGARLIRWLEAGGNPFLGKQNFLQAYYSAIGQHAEKAPPDPGQEIDWIRLNFKKPGQVKAVNKQVYERRDQFLVHVNTIACPLSGGAWEKANAAWLEFAENYKE